MKKNKGFTLVELLVVIAIIGLLSTIAVVSLGTARGKARDTKRIADMKQVQTALEQYYNDMNGYPSVATIGTYPAQHATNNCVLGGSTAKTLTTTNTTAACTATGSFGTGTAGTVYMGLVPAYPLPGKSGGATDCAGYGPNYCYTSNTAFATGLSTAYTIFWQLENVNNSLGTTTNCQTTNAGTVCSS
jgi:prepilin-type N-terminal cleavage/methylation domain-containing protein